MRHSATPVVLAIVFASAYFALGPGCFFSVDEVVVEEMARSVYQRGNLEIPAIDTAIQGGPLDGTLGVIAGFLALRALKEAHGPPRRTLEVVAVCDEEASRFHSNFWGSRAIAGLIRPGEAESIFDADGISLADAMRGCQLDPSAVEKARRDDIDTFIELHIEQGPLLEREGVPVGVVRLNVYSSALLVPVTVTF